MFVISLPLCHVDIRLTVSDGLSLGMLQRLTIHLLSCSIRVMLGWLPSPGLTSASITRTRRRVGWQLADSLDQQSLLLASVHSALVGRARSTRSASAPLATIRIWLSSGG